MRIKITNLQSNISISRKEIRSLAEKVISLYTKKRYEAALIFVDNTYIKKINRQYLDKNRSTDVIAFGMQEGRGVKGSSLFLGDIFISAQKAEQNAQKYNNSTKKELSIYVIHGILHLLQGIGKIPKGHGIILKLQEEIYEKLYRSKK